MFNRNSFNSTHAEHGNRSGIRQIFTPNIGTIIFGIIFVYMLISVFIYMTATHVRSYQVTAGPLTKNTNYTGLAVYSERLFRADAGGYINYYAADNAKIRSGGVVYGISSSRQEAKEQPVSAETLKKIHGNIDSFAQTFSDTDFHNIYSLKYQVEGAILNAALDGSTSSSTMTIGDSTLNMAPMEGVISYTTDGMEDLKDRAITADDFDRKLYEMKSLKTGDAVKTGDPVYRLIDSENWSLLIPLSAQQIVRLGDISNIRVKFLKDGITQKATLTILTMENGSYYGKLDFTSGMIRYLDNRFIDIELVTNTQLGLKIPVSSIVTKRFFTVPDEYAAFGGDSNEIGFLKAVTDREGNATTQFVMPVIYDHANGRYYLDDTEFSAGDIIIREGSTDRFIIKDSAELEGVYNMNKGYAVFRRVNIIDKNEDYCIVEKGTSYGIAQFDNIVENASDVHDSQITAR